MCVIDLGPVWINTYSINTNHISAYVLAISITKDKIKLSKLSFITYGQVISCFRKPYQIVSGISIDK